MEWAALFSLIQSWGPTAISSVLIIVVLYLIKKIDANSEKDLKLIDELRREIKENSEKDSARMIEIRDYINVTLNSFGSRLSAVEKEYTKSDMFHRELSGWKAEINRLSDQVFSNFTELTKQIIGLFMQNKG